ncbi:MAG: BatA domain-containing protein [Chitinophagales bacterium]
MGFVFPWFLLALFALAIPILIHLFYFRRFKKVYFSDIRFLKQIQEEKSTLEKLKKRLILASRLLAIFFLILAFAQPFIGKNKQQHQQGSAAVAVYIDNSYSMGLKNAGESALAIAQQKAKEIAQAFQTDDKFILLTNDFDGTHQHWMQQQDFLDAVDKITLSSATRKIDAISKKQSALFQTIGAKNKLGFFISDFQKNTLAKSEDTNFIAHFLPILSNPKKNIFVDSCWFEQPVFTKNTNNKLLVRLKNSGNATAEKVRVSVKINDVVKAIDDVTIQAQSAVIDSFTISIAQAGWQRGEISFNDYPITFDDQFYFAFNILGQEKILSIDDAETPNNIASIFSNDAHFVLDKNNKGQVDYSAFSNYALIVINQVQEISSGLSASLKTYIENGGNVLLIPASQANITSYNTFLSNCQAGNFGELKTQTNEVTQLNLNEDVFKGVFSQVPKNVALPKISKFYPISSSNQANARTIMSTNLGSPFVAKYLVGKGYIYLLSVPLNSEFSNFQSNAIIVPLVYNMAVYKKNYPALYYYMGRDNLIELNNTTSGNESIYKLTNGKYEFIPENRSIGTSTLLRINTTLPVDGIYAISSQNKTFGLAAFNFDRTESVLDFASKETLKKYYSGKNQLVLDNTQANLAAEVKQIKDDILLWKVCVILSLLFLLIEILLIRFWK